MEENISREAGATAGQYTSPEDFQSLILEIGRIPAERNTTYSRMKLKLPVESVTSEEALVAGCMSRTIAVVGGTGPAGTGLALRWARAGEKSSSDRGMPRELSRSLKRSGSASGRGRRFPGWRIPQLVRPAISLCSRFGSQARRNC